MTAVLEQTLAAPETGIELVNRPLSFILVQAGRCAWDETWCQVERGILDASREMNVTVTLLGPDSAGSPQVDTKQIAALIDQAVAAQPNGIALTIHDPVGLRASILAAIDSGIPIIAYHAGSGPIQDDLPYLTYLGMDNLQGGYQGGQRLIQEGANAGVCVNDAPEQADRIARCKGFLLSFSEAGLTAEELDVPSDAVQAQAEIQEYIQSHAQVNAYLTTSTGSAQAFYAWLDSAGRSRSNLLHSTFEPDEAIRQRIEVGDTQFAIDSQPYLEGYEAVFWLTMINRYGFKPAMPVMPTGPYFIGKDNLGSKTNLDHAIRLSFVQHARCSWDSYWCVVEHGIQQAAQERNVQVSILGPDKFDLDQMAALIDQAVAEQPDGMGVTIPDPVVLHTAILNAIRAGIPVVAYDTANGPLKDDLPYLTFIGTDSDVEYQGGYLAGRRLIRAGAQAGVCANHQTGHVALDARCRGMTDAFNMIGLKVDTLDIGGNPEKALSILQDYAAAHPEVNAYLTLGGGDPGAVTFYRFVSASNLPRGRLLHGTYDLSEAVVTAVQDGTTLFTVDGQPYLMGYSAVMMLTLALRQDVWPVEPITATGPGFVDLSNIDIVKQLAGIYR